MEQLKARSEISHVYLILIKTSRVYYLRLFQVRFATLDEDSNDGVASQDSNDGVVRCLKGAFTNTSSTFREY